MEKRKKIKIPKGKKKFNKNERNGLIQGLILFNHIGITMVVCIGMCLFAGKWLDARFGTEPVLTLLFVVLGVASAMYSMYRIAMSYMKQNDKE